MIKHDYMINHNPEMMDFVRFCRGICHPKAGMNWERPLFFVFCDAEATIIFAGFPLGVCFYQIDQAPTQIG